MSQQALSEQMKQLPKIYKDFGGKRIVFDVQKMTPEMMEKIKEVIGEIRAKDSIYVRMPANEDQDHKEYLEEAQLSDPELMRRYGESEQAHAKRILSPKMNTADRAFDIINGLAPLFGQPVLDREEYNRVPMHEIRTFVFNILNFSDCEVAAEFYPKRIVDGRQFK